MYSKNFIVIYYIILSFYSTVFEENLKKHLKKCNALKKKLHPCFSPGINSGNSRQQHQQEMVSIK